ncbi:MAG: N-6 DNA methylase [Candidatus Competibacteraceae bacterium]|nr:N-6 DNA methylase [Candidatus Competibacteraceae bacterium]
MKSPAETYFAALAEILATGGGVQEASYYPALMNLLNAVGAMLKPRVLAVSQLQNTGAGNPDAGLFTANQLPKDAAAPLPGLLPERGVIEIKGMADDSWLTAGGVQVGKYWKRYRLVLVTNYRDFLLVGADRQGQPAVLETLRLAESVAEFLSRLQQPRAFAQSHGERLIEYLQRVMQCAAPLNNPRDVAWFLASYAREARTRLADKPDLPALLALRSALENALGLRFEAEDGEHFFRSTLIQTLFYGVFSAWVLRCQEQPNRPDPFDWRLASWILRVPMIRELFEQLSRPSQLLPLGLTEVLDWVNGVLDRVDREAFFRQFAAGNAVQYFYEPFLQVFDPELRKQLGVWYTPPEIVRYMVARVDAVLREELDIANGLADPEVFILDPCCGTGAYLTEVLRLIKTRLDEQGLGGLAGAKLKQAALERVFGFELLPAPYVVAHLQLGLLLQQWGAPLEADPPPGKMERLSVYLTNALTGWQPPDEEGKQRMEQLTMNFPELMAENQAAHQVKQERRILVILGNPPYNGFAGVAVEEEQELTRAYRQTRHAPAPQGQGLNDLYVRFFRMAERHIVEHSGRGVVCLISNYSWLDGLSFTGMRERYLEKFDRIWIDNLHGDRIISEYAPDGKTSETVFAMSGNLPGIKIGTQISLLARSSSESNVIRYRDLDHARAEERRAALSASIQQEDFNALYTELQPVAAIGFPFKPKLFKADYLTWPRLPELLPASFPGVKTSRDDALVDIDRAVLEQRMRKYFDPNVSDEEIRRIAPALLKKTARFDPKVTRAILQKRGFRSENIVRYAYRPFDVRWLYWEAETKLLDEKRSDYFPHVFPQNIWLEARQKQPKDEFDRGFVTRVLGDNFGNGLSSFFPLYLKPFASQDTYQPNLSPTATDYLTRLDADAPTLFHHIIAILHAPAYRTDNAGALKQDWPRLPLPATRERLLASAEFGRKIAALLDTETPLPGVTQGKPRPELATIALLTLPKDAALTSEYLKVTAGWGHAGKGGVTMPGKGKIASRALTDAELPGLGEETLDIYLNAQCYWKNMPRPVWEFTLGGYPVIKKWLSYRELELLGRPLSDDEALELTWIARRITALVLMRPVLDENYRDCITQGD